MKNKLLILLLIIFSLSIYSLTADPYDISFSIGQDNYRWWPDGVSFSYGVNFGLSKRFELNLWASSELTPHPFYNNLFAGEVNVTLIGLRSTGTKVAGSGINLLLGLGGFYTTPDNGGGVLLSFTPLTVGNPITGRRERLLKTTLGWDFINNKLVVAFSLLNLDFYVRGTYRDYDMTAPVV